MHKDILIGTTPAYHTYPDPSEGPAGGGGKHPGLVVIHEIWGLVPHIKDVADRFAAQGYSVVAPNLFHTLALEGRADQSLLAQMQQQETRDEAQKTMREVFAPVRSPEFGAQALAMLVQCVDYLAQDSGVDAEHIGVTGFCFGGTYSFALAAADPRIKAAVPFYGQPLQEEKIKNLHCPILAFYGAHDTALADSLPALKDAMQKEGKGFTAVMYPDTGHAFFNDTNERMYNAQDAADAWNKTLAFFAKNLKWEK
ncbi:MAG: dienelactone hydrolase family protein [bacterium]|nr:dienelactone hydrolase family protein [bacterium]